MTSYIKKDPRKSAGRIMNKSTIEFGSIFGSIYFACRESLYFSGFQGGYLGSKNPNQFATPYAFFYKGRACCLGYALAFRCMCRKAGIPCVVVETDKYGNNTKHAYNLVYISKKWYCCDPTWDVKTKAKDWKYFLQAYDAEWLRGKPSPHHIMGNLWYNAYNKKLSKSEDYLTKERRKVLSDAGL